MKQLVSEEEYRTKRCHYCETWLGVRWKISTEELNRVFYGVQGNVYCCDRCAAKHYIGNN